MKKNITKAIYIFLITCTFTIYNPIVSTTLVEAHSGRTDSQGGHHDYKNKSGLGSYHYHCGGHPAHLHKNGVCPYDPKDTISVSDYNSTMYVGDSDDFTYSITSVYSYVNPTITSSNPNVISVSGTNLSAKGVGTATITVSTNSATKMFTITVKEVMAQSIEFRSTSDKLQMGQTLNTLIHISPSNTTNKKITYTSSDENIATISSNGTIKGKSSGDVIITATTSNGISKDITLSIFEILPENIDCEENINLIVGDIVAYNISVLPDNANNKDFTVTIEDESLLSYTDGCLNAIKEGITNIHVETWNSISKDIPVKIDIIPVESISILDMTDYIFSNIVDINSKIQIETNVYPDNSTYKEITYKSSNPQVVSCENGNFSIIGTGKATIICTAHGDITNQFNIIVLDKTFIIICSTSVISCIAIVLIIILCIKKRKKRNTI